MEQPREFELAEPDRGSIPVRVTPASATGARRWLAAIEDRRRWLADCLERYGALLFRGFDVSSAEALAAFTRAAGFRLADYRRGITPRRAVHGGVYTATDAPPAFPIPLHNEMSYTSVYPTGVALCCETPPTRGGRTPIADMARVLDRLPVALVARFDALGVRYRQHVPSSSSSRRARSWQQMFDTEDRSEVERVCAAQGIDHRWVGDEIALDSVRPALLTHPRSGSRVWFNQVQVFHPSFSHELFHHRRWLLGLAVRAHEWTRAPRISCCHGDGTAIARRTMYVVRRALWAETRRFDWRRGDLLLLDNLRVAHGREPYRGARRVLAALISGAGGAGGGLGGQSDDAAPAAAGRAPAAGSSGGAPHRSS
ncbi:MAG TPA: TauD/TfdA family dioxygenase [Candidatus Polarisedimenticolaceae bacterium]|nr:TauD/TfdA family dioxygenase [Candidatus Polarisedimenticolaceae bacterium]